MNPSTGSEGAREILGSIVGAEAILEGTTEELTGVDAIDDRTLRVTLSAPRVDFAALLAEPVASVLKRENVEQWAFDYARWSDTSQAVLRLQADQIPVGTGPFKIHRFELFKTCVLIRNEHYYDDQAYLDGIVFAMEGLDDPNDLVNAFDGGHLDMRPRSAEFSKLLETGEETILGELHHFEWEPRSQFLAFNTGLEPYDDLHFRRALFAASDIEALAEELDRDVGRTLLRPEIAGYNPELAGIGYDPNLATRNAEQSRYGDELDEITLKFEEWLAGDYTAEFKAIANNWEDALGIETQYRHVDPSYYQRRLAEGKIQMVFQTTRPEYPDPSKVLNPFGSIFGKGDSSAQHQIVEGMIRKASSEPDPVVRLRLYSDIEAYILDEALAMPMFWPSEGYYIQVQPWVKGLIFPKYGGSRFKHVRIDTSHPGYPLDRSLR